MGRATIVPLVTCSHGNVRLDSVEPAGAADKSDVPAAAMFQARSFGSVRGSSRSSEARPRSGTAGLPAHGLWPELTVATGSSRSSFVHTAPGYLCPCRHSQAVKSLWFGRTLTQYLVTRDRPPPHPIAPLCPRSFPSACDVDPVLAMTWNSGHGLGECGGE